MQYWHSIEAGKFPFVLKLAGDKAKLRGWCLCHAQQQEECQSSRPSIELHGVAAKAVPQISTAEQGSTPGAVDSSSKGMAPLAQKPAVAAAPKSAAATT